MKDATAVGEIVDRLERAMGDIHNSQRWADEPAPGEYSDQSYMEWINEAMDAAHAEILALRARVAELEAWKERHLHDALGELQRMGQAEEAGWQPIEDLPPHPYKPWRVLVVVEGHQTHSGGQWRRAKFGLARTLAEGFYPEDIKAIADADHMDAGSYRVTHFMPIKVPALPQFAPPTEGDA